ncbi:MAG: hypothetical protein JWQ27_1953 [Ferruginibacter sp.]|nr:hypothetical protein [Ferruginibacter sp.]
MQILVVAATEMEIAPFLAGHPSADILITGVGCPETMYQLTKRLHQIDYDMVVQAGIAGCFNEADLGQVFLIERDLFADLGIREQGRLLSLFDMGFADKDHFPFSDGWLINPELRQRFPGLPQRKGITVNTVGEDEEATRFYLEKFQPAIESMEGAALHYICLREEVPFIQIRSTSNMVGERDKTKWKMKQAIEKLNEALPALLPQFK